MAIKKYILSIKTIPHSAFKTGMRFRATRDNKTIVEGIIHVHSGTVYLCQNSWNGATSPNRHGYKNSWSIGYRESWISGTDTIIGLELFPINKHSEEVAKLEKALAVARAAEKVELDKIAAEEAKRKAELEFPKKFHSWNIAKVGSDYSFGCGSVRFSKTELAAYNKVAKALKSREPRLAKDRTKYYDEAITVSGKLGGVK